MSDNRYRPQSSRRDSDDWSRSPDRPSDRYRSADRGPDYTGTGDNRYRDSRINSRATDLIPASRRPVPETQASRMDPDRACADVARLLRARDDALVNKVKWAQSKDTKLAGYQRRLAEYEKLKVGNSYEPSIVEAYDRQKSHYKEEKEKIEKELNNANAVVDRTTNDLARCLVKALPVNEIKERQLIEAVRRELDKGGRQATQDDHSPEQDVRIPQLQKQLDTLSGDYVAAVGRLEKAETRVQSTAIIDRTQKLEEQMESLLKSFETQQDTLDKLQRDNKELGTRNTTFLQAQKDANVSQDSQLEALRQEKDSLVSEVLALRTQVNDLKERIDLQNTDFPTSVRKARAELETSLREATAKMNTPPAHSILPQEFKELEKLVKEHEVVLRNIDADEYTDAMSKLLVYPPYNDLKTSIQRQQDELRRIGLETTGLNAKVTRYGQWENRFKSLTDAASARNEQWEDRFKSLTDAASARNEQWELKFTGFSTKIVQTCEHIVQDLKTKVEQIGPRISSLEIASRAPSVAVTASPRPTNLGLNGNAMELGAAMNEPRVTEPNLQGARADVDSIHKMVVKLEQEMRETHNAHEMMIIGLDEQFKNMTTIELASIILQHLKPTNIVPREVQNFHERLTDLELFRQELSQKSRTQVRPLIDQIRKYTDVTGESLGQQKRLE